MPRIDSEQFYHSSIKKHGRSAQGVNWVSQETQELRFDIILDMLPNKIDSLADAGCGFGDFFTYLQYATTKCNKYIGIDSLVEMCTIATENTKEEIILANITVDVLPSCEYYICSGAMNILNSFETHMFIQNCLQASEKAFIFNILCGNKESDRFNYITANKIKKIAKSLGVKRIEMRDDYMNNDITVGFFH
ncbi:MAG: SAM-dependent methyltransferase [Sulfurimonas sp.]|jgi:SAM-dependent methyltransferase|uniref:class I SAM-dependent methyltransferase n=1 Tax=Sulfurimonas sp. TaxID=2022749 RepID=UPI0039E61A2D